MRWQLVALALWTVPALGAELPFGKNVTPADRALVMKLMDVDLQDVNPQQDLEIAKVDLNGDGHLDYVVLVTGAIYCGSHGCNGAVFVADGEKYRRVADLLAHSIELGDGTTKGARDLLHDGKTRWVWDGREYRQVLPGK